MLDARHLLVSSDGDVGTPEWWITRLDRKLFDDRATGDLWQRYYIGDHPFPQVPEKVRPRIEHSYREILARSNANFMATVVDAIVERCRPIGFRLGADSDHAADLDSWRIWQASNMDADAPLAIEAATIRGRSALSVWRYDGDELPTIAVEDSSQCIVEMTPGSRHRRAAALKRYVDDWTGADRGDLYLRNPIPGRPGQLHRFTRTSEGGGWVREGDPIDNPAGYPGIPVVPLINRPQLGFVAAQTRKQLLWGGDSELGDVTAIQDRMNEGILNRVIAMWFAAFRQRYATGLVIDEEPLIGGDGKPVLGTDGKPIMKPVEPFDAWADRLWTADDPNVKFGDLGSTDLTQYLSTHERDLQDLSTIKRVPRHYLFQEGQSPSGDAIKSAETGLVARVRRKLLDFGDSFEEANRIARFMAGDGEAGPDSEMVWDDPEYRSYGELVDGVIKEVGAGLLPWEGAMEKLGYSPQQIRRFRGQRSMEQLLNALREVDGTESTTAGARPEMPTAPALAGA